jgi:putative transposase
LPLSFYFTLANVPNTYGARCQLAGLELFVPRLTKIWADQASQGHNLAGWCRTTGDWELEVVKRTLDMRGWSRQPQRRSVERILAWLLRNRRLIGDFACTVQSSANFTEDAKIRLLVARLGRQI